MVKVNFLNENKIVDAEEGNTIETIARKAGVFVETPCGGEGNCGKCKVKVSDMNAVFVMDSNKKISDGELDENIVLACQTKVIGDVCVITSVDKEANETMQILSEGKDLAVEINPLYHKEFVPDLGQTRVYKGMEPVGMEKGNTSDKLYGVTVDIGTTTLVATLVDCLTGEQIDDLSSLNPQCAYAQDVVSRIKYTSTAEDGLRVLYEAVRDEINNMIRELCEKNKVAAEYIYEVVYSGNTTMMHLATDTDPYSLGQYPYTPVISGGNDIDVRKCGLIISEFGSVYLPPIISSYVGADITSGVLACKLADKVKNVLFIDIGTNGEMILEINGKLTACSTAAGPAFEGMNITFGMRAGNGAIEYFKITDDDIEIRTIGDKEAKGICGSGLFDVVGELVRVGIIEKNGKIIKKEKCTLSKNIVDRITKYEGKSAFLVADNVYLTLLDIRQIQLAKSAIRAGIEAMTGLNKARMSDIDEVYIAGSFGYHLTPESLVNTGIIPKELQGKIKFVGNTSKTGGNAFLLNVNTRKYISEVVKEINTIELSDYPGFEALFIEKMSF